MRVFPGIQRLPSLIPLALPGNDASAVGPDAMDDEDLFFVCEEIGLHRRGGQQQKNGDSPQTRDDPVDNVDPLGMSRWEYVPRTFQPGIPRTSICATPYEIKPPAISTHELGRQRMTHVRSRWHWPKCRSAAPVPDGCSTFRSVVNDHPRPWTTHNEHKCGCDQRFTGPQEEPQGCHSGKPLSPSCGSQDTSPDLP